MVKYKTDIGLSRRTTDIIRDSWEHRTRPSNQLVAFDTRYTYISLTECPASSPYLEFDIETIVFDAVERKEPNVLQRSPNIRYLPFLVPGLWFLELGSGGEYFETFLSDLYCNSPDILQKRLLLFRRSASLVPRD